jgi:hypothetical protein
MKKLQQFFAAGILTLLFSLSSFAGDGIIYPLRTEPTATPTPVMATTNEAEDEGIITTLRTATDSVTEVALSVLPSVLALF